MNIIRTKVKNKFLFVEFEADLVRHMDKFIVHVLECHCIQPDEYDIILLDQYKTPINSSNFSSVMNKYSQCSNFFIEFVCSAVDKTKTTPHEVRQKLDSFLSESTKATEALQEYEKNKQLKVSSRQNVVNAVCDFIVELFGINAEPQKIRIVCGELIDIFPCWRTEPSRIGGIDVLYNSAKCSGFVYNTLRYRKYKSKPRAKEQIDENNDNTDGEETIEAMQNLSLDDKSFSEEEQEQVLTYFKTCLVRNEKNVLLEKLKETVSLRMGVLTARRTNFAENFPFYFVSPDLILEDFKIRWPNINENALEEKWSMISAKIDHWKSPKFDKSYDCIDPNINRIINLFDRLRSRRITLKKSLKNFLIIQKDPLADPTAELHSKRDFAYIICVGSNSSNIQYHIHVRDHQLIPVPKGFSLIQVLDLFFKIFKVFILQYHPNYVGLMNFFGRFVYSTEENGILYARLLELRNEIFPVNGESESSN